MPGEPLRVGVIGLGDIAQKAYLPVLAARADVTLTLLGRDNDGLTRIGRQYGAPRCVTRLDDLLDSGIDVAFVHTSTEAHFGLVEHLLSAGIHVLVDKPLAPSLADARHLVALAERQGRSLAVGFNRRFAPAYAPLARLDRSVVLMQKNRVGMPGEPRRLVFDDFIHVVDTLRFLMPPGEEQVDIRCSVADGFLRTVTLGLHVEDVTGLGVMHRVSGSNEEVLEVLGTGTSTAWLISPKSGGTTQVSPRLYAWSGEATGRRRRPSAASRPCARSSSTLCTPVGSSRPATPFAPTKSARTSCSPRKLPAPGPDSGSSTGHRSTTGDP